MPSVAILAVEGCYVSCAAGFADVLQAANAHLRQQQGAGCRPFEWSFVSAEGGPVAASNGMHIETEALPGEPALRRRDDPGDPLPGLQAVRSLPRPASRRSTSGCARSGTARRWIGANCTGTFMLAQSGLLDGRAATTTWWLDRQFRSRYPAVDLQYRSVLTETDRLLCAGATATYLLQAVRIVERFMGPHIASQCAKSMLIDVSHTGRIPYVPLLTETHHADSIVERAQHWLQKNMARAVTMPDLARAVAVSDRTLVRRFAAAIGQTPIGLSAGGSPRCRTRLARGRRHGRAVRRDAGRLQRRELVLASVQAGRRPQSRGVPAQVPDS